MNLWRDRTFLTYWLASSISTLGFQLSTVAMPLVAVLTLHATAADMGLLRATVGLPNLLFGAIAGVWIDRLPRRPVLIVTGLLGALVVATIPAAYVSGLLVLPQLFVTSFVAGTLGVFGLLAAGAYLPAIVEREALLEANSKMATTSSTLAIVGPGIGGFLVQIVTAPIALLAEALMSVLGAVVLSTVRKPEPIPTGSPSERHLRAEVAEGLRVLLGHPVLRVLMFLIAFANLFSALAQAVFVLYMARVLRLPPATIGLVFAAAGPGSLAGALIARRLSTRIGIGPSIVVGAIVFCIGWAIAPLASGGLAVEVPLLVVSQFLLFMGAMAANINAFSLRQVIVPGRLLGRVNGSMLIAANGVAPVGALIGGLVGQAWGPREALWVAAAGSLAAIVVSVLSPLRRIRTAGEAAAIHPLEPASAGSEPARPSG